MTKKLLNMKENKIFGAIVVDDEPLARRLLISSLKAYPEIEVIGEYGNGRKAIEAIKELSPDLMFLDVQMPGMSGFDVIRAVNPENMPETIFVTAFDSYAIDAFDANAVDYILKPISDDRLARAVSRVMLHLNKEQLQSAQKKNLYGAMSKIADRVKNKTSEEEEFLDAIEERKISIKDGDTVTLVPESEIDWIDAAGDYMCVHVKGDTHVIRSTLHQLLSRLDNDRFKRVHRSTVVNTDRIIKIQKHTKGEYLLFLDCDETIKVSRHYKKVIREFIDLQP